MWVPCMTPFYYTIICAPAGDEELAHGVEEHILNGVLVPLQVLHLRLLLCVEQPALY